MVSFLVADIEDGRKRELLYKEHKTEEHHYYNKNPILVPLPLSTCLYIDNDRFLFGVNTLTRGGLYLWTRQNNTVLQILDKRVSCLKMIGKILIVMFMFDDKLVYYA